METTHKIVERPVFGVNTIRLVDTETDWQCCASNEAIIYSPVIPTTGIRAILTYDSSIKRGSLKASDL